MSRILTDTLKAQIEAAIPDNDTRQVSPADVRNALLNIIDSLRPSFAALRGEHSTAPFNFSLTETWQPLVAPGLFTIAGGSDRAELNWDEGNGEIITVYDGWVHWLDAGVSCTGDTNDEVQFALMENGVAGENIIEVTMQGSSKLVWVNSRGARLPPAGTRYQLAARSKPGVGATNLNIYLIAFTGELSTSRSI